MSTTMLVNQTPESRVGKWRQAVETPSEGSFIDSDGEELPLAMSRKAMMRYAPEANPTPAPQKRPGSSPEASGARKKAPTTSAAPRAKCKVSKRASSVPRNRPRSKQRRSSAATRLRAVMRGEESEDEDEAMVFAGRDVHGGDASARHVDDCPGEGGSPGIRGNKGSRGRY